MMNATAAVPIEVGAALRAYVRENRRASSRAAGALDLILEILRRDGNGAFPGKLTGDGFPVELVFSSLDDRIRYTCDVAGSSIPPVQRLERAQELLTALRKPATFPLDRLQYDAPALGWGAWLAGRHSSETDDYKIYAEAPESLSLLARTQLEQSLGRFSALLESHAFLLRLVAADDCGNLEFYFRTASMAPRELSRVIDFCGLGAQWDPLFGLIAEASRKPVAARLPGAQHGFSLALGSDGEPRAFTFLAFARSVFGQDVSARKTMLELAEKYHWALPGYATISGHVPPRTVRGPHHGLVSFIARREGQVGLGIGLRPPLPRESTP